MDLKTLRLLIVDDYTMFRQGLRTLLAEARDLVVVGEAGDGYEAVHKTRQLQPDVVLMDIHLPDCDGLEATATITREFPAVKVIMVAGDNNDPDLIYRAIHAGAMGYVSKHSSVDELVEAVRLVARGEAILTPRSVTALVNFIRETADKSSSKVTAIDRLSVREQEVLDLLSQGYSNREIGSQLCVTESTVRAHIHNVLDKLQLSNRVQAATFALGLRQIGNGALSK